LGFQWRAPGRDALTRLNGVLHSSALRLAGELLVLLAAVLWVGLAFRVHRDARRRVDGGFLVALATLLGLAVPFVGPLVYLLFRPPETLEESRVRRVELLALRDRIGRPEPGCGGPRAAAASEDTVTGVAGDGVKRAIAASAATPPVSSYVAESLTSSEVRSARPTANTRSRVDARRYAKYTAAPKVATSQ